MRDIILIGGGKGADLFIRSFHTYDKVFLSKDCRILGILDDKATGKRFCDIPIIGKTKDILNFDSKNTDLLITISSNMKFRKDFYNEYRTIYKFINFH